jgi:hypothetical protein
MSKNMNKRATKSTRATENSILTFLKYLVFWSSTTAVFTAVLIMSSMIHLTILSLDTDETVRNVSIEFSVALLLLVARLFMFLLIFGNPSFSTNNVFPNLLSFYFLRKPHLCVILTAIGWFIVNIQSDLFWHRCLERQTWEHIVRWKWGITENEQEHE